MPRWWLRQSAYALSRASSDIVGKSSPVVGVAHKDSGLDCLESVAGQSRARTTANGVVHNLATLLEVSFWS